MAGVAGVAGVAGATGQPSGATAREVLAAGHTVHASTRSPESQAARALGFPSFTILRAVFFMDNVTSPLFKTAIDHGLLAVGMSPTTPRQMMAVAHIGRDERAAGRR